MSHPASQLHSSFFSTSAAASFYSGIRSPNHSSVPRVSSAPPPTSQQQQQQLPRIIISPAYHHLSPEPPTLAAAAPQHLTNYPAPTFSQQQQQQQQPQSEDEENAAFYLLLQILTASSARKQGEALPEPPRSGPKHLKKLMDGAFLNCFDFCGTTRPIQGNAFYKVEVSRQNKTVRLTNSQGLDYDLSELCEVQRGLSPDVTPTAGRFGFRLIFTDKPILNLEAMTLAQLRVWLIVMDLICSINGRKRVPESVQAAPENTRREKSEVEEGNNLINWMAQKAQLNGAQAKNSSCNNQQQQQQQQQQQPYGNRFSPTAWFDRKVQEENRRQDEEARFSHNGSSGAAPTSPVMSVAFLNMLTNISSTSSSATVVISFPDHRGHPANFMGFRNGKMTISPHPTFFEQFKADTPPHIPLLYPSKTVEFSFNLVMQATTAGHGWQQQQQQHLICARDPLPLLESGLAVPISNAVTTLPLGQVRRETAARPSVITRFTDGSCALGRWLFVANWIGIRAQVVLEMPQQNRKHPVQLDFIEASQLLQGPKGNYIHAGKRYSEEYHSF